MSIILVGLNHRTAPVELREQLALTEAELRTALHELWTANLLPQGDNDLAVTGCPPAELHEVVIVSTCNRLEIYGVTLDAVPDAWDRVEGYLSCLRRIEPYRLHPHLYFMEGEPAINHLLSVAAGLDSAVLGESQILGQVADALNDAHEAGTTGPSLSHLFAQAVHTGKRARTETAISQYTTSVSHMAALMAQQQSGDLSKVNVLVVGAGEMATLAVQALQMHGAQHFAVLNRTESRAAELAEKVGGRPLTWVQLGEGLVWADVVITATGAPHTIIYAADVDKVVPARQDRRLIFVDIAVPRDVEETVGKLPGIQLFDIDDLQDALDSNLAQRRAAVPDVETIVDDETRAFLEWLNSRQVAPVIADLHRKAEAMAEAELELALQKMKGLSQHDQAIVERLAHRIVNKLLHEPTIRLKTLAAAGDDYGYAHAVRDLFMLDGNGMEREKEMAISGAKR